MAPPEQITAPALQELLKGAALAGAWILDPLRSTVALKSKILGLAPVNGLFRHVTGAGTITPASEGSGAITVAAASIDTKNTQRDTHLRSADFFDSENYPDITFTLEGIRTAVIQGHGEVWLDAEVHINRADFGLTWNLMGLVSMNNTLTIHAVFTKQ